MKILLAEDDLRLGKMLKTILSKNGINVKWVTNGESAYDECYADGYDVLVLDWMMPGMSGIKLCSVMLTARDSLDDKVNGLNAGADDYLVKPFAVAELLARLNALVRRQGSYMEENVEYKGFVLNSGDYTISYGGSKVQLRPREFKLIELLLRNAGKIIPRDVILERVWGIESDITENNLDVHIGALRRKLKEIKGETLIKTIRGVGYLAEADDNVR